MANSTLIATKTVIRGGKTFNYLLHITTDKASETQFNISSTSLTGAIHTSQLQDIVLISRLYNRTSIDPGTKEALIADGWKFISDIKEGWRD